MTAKQRHMPLALLVAELFERAPRRRGLLALGCALALASHAAAGLLFVTQHASAALERAPPPVEVSFVSVPAPTATTLAPASELPAAGAHSKATSVAPPAAARAGALHLARADAAPAQQSNTALDFTTDLNGTSYGGGVVALGGTADFGLTGARAVTRAGSTPLAPANGGQVRDPLTAASDLSRKPTLPGADPCRGFFPSSAEGDAGDVLLMVTILRSGKVQSSQLLSEDPRAQGFGPAARRCLSGQSFTPAQDRTGNSVATAMRVKIRFSR